jgi:hypothetical protein
MGLYINPTNGQTKEEWLETNASRLPSFQPTEEQWQLIRSNDSIPVCHVDNGAFTAAAIGYCLEECQAFVYPDGRPKVWWTVPIARLPHDSGISHPDIQHFIQPES